MNFKFFMLLILGLNCLACTHYGSAQSSLDEARRAAASLAPRPQEAPHRRGEFEPEPLQSSAAVFRPSRWTLFGKSWAIFFLDLAQIEDGLRNYALAEKYAKLSLLWSERARELKGLAEAAAIRKMRIWLDGLALPALPGMPTYFAGADAQRELSRIRGELSGPLHRLSLVAQGYPLVQAFGLYEYAVDQLKLKNYQEAFFRAQNIPSPLATAREGDESRADLDRDGLPDLLDPCPEDPGECPDGPTP